MSCRESNFNSGITSYARVRNGLTDSQIMSLSHALRREAPGAPAPTREQYAVLLQSRVDQVEQDPALTEARRVSVLRRLALARELPPVKGPEFHAAIRMEDRARDAAGALATYQERAARDLGVSRVAARGRFDQAMRAAQADVSLAPSAYWQDRLAADPTSRYLPKDRSTGWALQQVEMARRERLAFSPARPAVTRVPVKSSAVASAGYDPGSGRLEIEMRDKDGSPSGRVYAYRVPEHVHAQMLSSRSVGSYYARKIRGNPGYQYETAEQAHAASVHRACPTCGEFAGPGHACPVPDGTPAVVVPAQRPHRTRNSPVRPAGGRAGASGSAGPPNGSGAVAGGPPNPTAGPVAHVDEPGTTVVYRTDTMTTRTMPAVALRQHATMTDGPVTVPVRGAGTAGGTNGTVTGNVSVLAAADGQFTVDRVAADTPGVRPGSELRCSCPQYRASYDCAHVREVLADVTGRLNSTTGPAPADLERATGAVAVALAADRDASVASQTRARAAQGTSAVSYVDDPEAFRADVDAALARKAAGLPAVEYVTVNALGGFGDRDGGRGFGVEIEFDFRPGTDHQEVVAAIAAIAADLNAAGLTPTADMEEHGTAKEAGYTDAHAGGWTYENDDSTSGGELVSPIMYDEPETWQNLQIVCDTIKRHGGVATVNTGQHVHVGVGDYDHEIGNHSRLLTAFRENTDLLYRLGTNPERGTHRGFEYAYPNPVPAAGYAELSAARKGSAKYHAVNLVQVQGRPQDHVEFRQWDATLDPAVIQGQLRTSVALVAAAHRETGVPAEVPQTPVGTHRDLARAGQALGAAPGATPPDPQAEWLRDTEQVRRLADRLYSRPEDKAGLAALFAVTSWQGLVPADRTDPNLDR